VFYSVTCIVEITNFVIINNVHAHLYLYITGNWVMAFYMLVFSLSAIVPLGFAFENIRESWGPYCWYYLPGMFYCY